MINEKLGYPTGPKDDCPQWTIQLAELNELFRLKHPKCDYLCGVPAIRIDFGGPVVIELVCGDCGEVIESIFIQPPDEPTRRDVVHLGDNQNQGEI